MINSIVSCSYLIRAIAPKKLNLIACRSLYSASALGVDNYTKSRDRVKNQFLNIEDKFKSKMLDFAQSDSSSMIFTEDLKHMIHLAEGNQEDLELVKNMMLKFSKQNKDLRFGSFIFGPVVMRMYYHINKPREAYEMFKNPEMDGFFDQLVTFQILMDLLFENEMYKEIVEVFDVVQKKQVQGAKYPKNAVVLVLAACYKMNTPESYNYAKHLWAELTKVGHYPMRRAGTFAAALALNQGAPHVSLEIISSLKQQSYVTVRNLKVAALAALKRPDDVLPILRAAIQIDTASDKKHTFAEETIVRVKSSVEEFGNTEITQEFEKLEKQLRTLNQISQEPLDNQLCSEISAVNMPPREGHMKFDRRTYRLRPGLEEMF